MAMQRFFKFLKRKILSVKPRRLFITEPLYYGSRNNKINKNLRNRHDGEIK